MGRALAVLLLVVLLAAPGGVPSAHAQTATPTGCQTLPSRVSGNFSFAQWGSVNALSVSRYGNYQGWTVKVVPTNWAPVATEIWTLRIRDAQANATTWAINQPNVPFAVTMAGSAQHEMDLWLSTPDPSSAYTWNTVLCPPGVTDATATPTPSATPSATATATPLPSETPTVVPSPTSTQEPVSTHAPGETPSPTPEASATAAPTSTNTPLASPVDAAAMVALATEVALLRADIPAATNYQNATGSFTAILLLCVLVVGLVRTAGGR